MATSKEAPAQVEQRTIRQIPLTERHGRARDLFTIWFGSNLMLLTIVTGALATTVFKLPFLDAVAAIIIGNVVGGVVMALHAAQGPQLGVPQMVQTRGQFGSVGAVLVIAIVVIMYVGFYASNMVLGGQSLHTIIPGIDQNILFIVIDVLSLIAAIYGHDLIHVYARILTWLAGLALVLSFAWILLVNGLPANFGSLNSFTTAGFFSMIATGALWQIAYAPYVSDYSRYMPRDTGVRPAFWASYTGCASGSILPMILGALVGILVTNGDVLGGLTRLTGAVAIPIVVIFCLGVACTNAMNLYCGVLSSITVIQTGLPTWSPGAFARTVAAVIIAVIGFVISVLGAQNFLAAYTNFILLLFYVLVPWTAVNLVDFYLVRHGNYDVEAFFTHDGGIYGRFNWAAISCYVLGIIVQLPFIATPLYTGPAARALGGVDISWIVGLLVVSPVYYVLVRKHGDVAPAMRAA